METPSIVITSADFTRLQRVLERHDDPRDQGAVETLAAELSRARITVPGELPADVVTMNALVRYVDEVGGQSNTVTVVYPADADPQAGRVSVLAPIGCALLGLSVGQTIEWTLPDGERRAFRIQEVVHQPESVAVLHR